MGGQRPDKKKVQTHAMMMWVMTMTMATKTHNGILTSVTYGVYKSQLVGCPAETIKKNLKKSLSNSPPAGRCGVLSLIPR